MPRVSLAPMRKTTSLVALFMVAVTGVALAQPAGGPTARRPPPPSPAPAAAFSWDSRGWQMLGEQQVSGNVDKDRITVGRYEGKFNKLTLVVLDSDLEMLEFKVVFADRTTFDPKVSQFFRENQRTRVIDLPPSENVIQRIDLKYRNLAGGGRAKVQVWGFKTANASPPPVVVPWDSKGWTKLGERDVNGNVDKDRIEVGRYEGKFTKLTVVVRDSDLEMLDFAVKFGRGPEWRPANVNHYFRENTRTRVIDFPGDERTIKYIDFKYRNLAGGGRAKVEVWGQLGGGKDSKPAPFAWDQKGWTMLGERTVNGRADKDRIDVGREEGKFRKLTVVVLDSDLAMIDMEIKFGRGPTFRPDVKQDFREGTRTRVIDLPGDDRVIKWIEFKYKNLPGGGNAKVQVWAK